uniref:Helicase ATP-binding domain-containing protein n=1 Tax=Panagrolaimus superbus TaxID=310955 RepID=A0A914YV58_9BILA
MVCNNWHWKFFLKERNNFDVVIVDECHRDDLTMLLNLYIALKDGFKKIILMSASIDDIFVQDFKKIAPNFHHLKCEAAVSYAVSIVTDGFVPMPEIPGEPFTVFPKAEQVADMMACALVEFFERTPPPNVGPNILRFGSGMKQISAGKNACYKILKRHGYTIVLLHSKIERADDAFEIAKKELTCVCLHHKCY